MPRVYTGTVSRSAAGGRTTAQKGTIQWLSLSICCLEGQSERFAPTATRSPRRDSPREVVIFLQGCFESAQGHLRLQQKRLGQSF